MASLFIVGGLSAWAGWASQSIAPFTVGMLARLHDGDARHGVDA